MMMQKENGDVSGTLRYQRRRDIRTYEHTNIRTYERTSIRTNRRTARWIEPVVVQFTSFVSQESPRK